ncbi:hypothetical protein [Moraxella sp. Pampa]|uniref:hypothetical protein n=1 Tax=Moraxella sp. Pampa TaxID=3111978 RepID=UPI002B4015E0|nr:hypothetical protein [Moraxella sp. Pampa]
MLRTNPTPYYAQDFVFELSYGNDYLGGSARTQFNALYGANLPVAANIKKPTKKLPTVPRFANTQESLTPDEIARENMNLANAAMMADDMGYDISGRMVSHRILASIFSTEDGVSWDIAERIAPPAKVSDMTPEELIEYIATRRYGDSQWFVDMAKMNMRGLQTELIAMQAEKKILEKELIMAERAVEKQLAAYLSIKNKSQEMLNQAMYDGIIANAIPDIIAAHLEKKGDEFVETGGFDDSMSVADADLTNIPADLAPLLNELLEGIAHSEAKSYEAYNNGSIDGPCGGSLNKSKPKGDGVTKLTEMTMAQLKARANAPCSTKIFAAGMYQIIPDTLKGLLISLPHLRNSKFTPAVQKEMALQLMKERKHINAWLAGKDVPIDRAVYNVSKIWASVAVPKGLPRAKAPYQMAIKAIMAQAINQMRLLIR